MPRRTMALLALALTLSACGRKTPDMATTPAKPATPEVRHAVGLDVKKWGADIYIERYVDTEAGVVCYSQSSSLSCVPLNSTRLAKQ